jgi:hypothetical protein
VIGEIDPVRKLTNPALAKTISIRPLALMVSWGQKVGQLGKVSLDARNVAADCRYGLVQFPLATASQR